MACHVTWIEKQTMFSGRPGPLLSHGCDLKDFHDEKAKEVGVTGVHQCRCGAAHKIQPLRRGGR